MSNRQNKKGFTIIEVVLVLAIAGLIFAMIFIALPALQRAQRNAERRNNASIMKAAFMQWSKNNRITVTDNYGHKYDPDGFCTFYARYLPELRDPSTGEPYKVALWGTTKVVDCVNKREIERGQYDLDIHGSGSTNQGKNWALMEVGDMQFDDTAICNEDGGFNDDISSYTGGGSYVHSGTRLFAIRIKLEGGATMCIDGEYQ